MAHCSSTRASASRLTTKPEAPHLSMKGRVWCKVEVAGMWHTFDRPEAQGGTWILSPWLKVTEILS